MKDVSYHTSDMTFLVNVKEKVDVIWVHFSGKSQMRDPSEFLNPILNDVLDIARAAEKKIILNFYNLVYMNSSTVSPIIKYWAKVKDLKIFLTLEYNGAVKWQKTSFAGFSIFAAESIYFQLTER